MIALAWSVFAFLAVLWTAGTWIVTQFVAWGAQVLGTGRLPQVGYEPADWPLPEWLRIWMDPAWIAALQTVARDTLEAVAPMLPLAGSALGWVIPLVWFVWGLGFLGLLACAVLAHVLVRRASARGGVAIGR